MIGAYNISEDLITWLRKTFTNKLPTDKSCSIEYIRFLQGQQEVINVIHETYKESLDDVYDTSTTTT